MAKFDIESFRDYWIDLIKAGLTAKLAEITTEKGDSLVLATFSDEQWTNDYNKKVLNYESFVLYSMEISNPETVGNAANIEIKLFIEIVFANREGGIEVENRILRYTRAMMEIVLENSRKNASISGVTIREFVPVPIKISVNSPVMKTGAVEITGTITT